MDKRITIGLHFGYNENWVGGSYYILNLIQSLKLLEDRNLPKLVIISGNILDFKYVKEINYPYVSYKLLKKQMVFFRIINKISIKIFNYKIFNHKTFHHKIIIKTFYQKIDVIFPDKANPSLDWIKCKLAWIPDFQELHLPQFYPNANLEVRKQKSIDFSISKSNLLLSSFDAKKDYDFFFPENNTANYVLNFAVSHPDFSNLGNEVFEKYGLQKDNYFFSPNQFWKHKNQIVVLKAIALQKKQGKLDFIVAFSGKNHDYRNPDYFQELETYILENNIQEHVKFLGFIDRKDQLFLMQNAKAVIQPSLFEGWSTVVEDCKKLNQNCIVSNLNVHQEQLGSNGFYFNPNDEIQLLDLLVKFCKSDIAKPDFKYQESFALFGENFVKIINQILKQQE
jgi:glycosyltransferase involved in cell wall biosynthesis